MKSKLLPRSKNTLTIPERQIQQMIINYLKYKGWYVMRLNSGKYSMGEGRSRRFVMGQEAGTPDLMAFKAVNHYGCPLINMIPDLWFIEVKREGNKPTVLQKQKMLELNGKGAKCVVAYGIEDLEKVGL